MKAVRFTRYGGPEVLRLEELPTPEPAPGQLLIRTHAVGINPIDWKMRRGLFGAEDAPAEPQGTGLELSGVVEAVGPELVGPDVPSVGQAVFGNVGPRAAATHVLTTPDKVLVKPDWLAFDQAAALPVAAETGYRTMRLLEVKDGHTLLIHAVAGGVGLVASQLAMARGARVVGTASERHHAYLQSIGVVPVAYGDGWEERVRAAAPQGIDRVLDASGRGVLPASVELTGDPDHVLSIADMSEVDRGVRFSGGSPDPLPEVFDTVLPLVRDGKLELPIEQRFPLEQIADAHRLSESGHLRGKILLTV